MTGGLSKNKLINLKSPTYKAVLIEIQNSPENILPF